MTKIIPLLITVDLEIALDHHMNEQAQILNKLKLDLKNVPSTWFCTAVAAEQFNEYIYELILEGHEVGCHGVDHSAKDNYQNMSPACAETAIAEATYRIEYAVGQKPRCFRGPRMTTSSSTQMALINYGYLSDFSVCAQRMDLLTSGGANLGWLFAPRGAYYPSKEKSFRAGTQPLVVVNLSCLGLPFLSGMLYIMGLSFMKAFFRILLFEARHKGFPIVYLFHSYEFANLNGISYQPFHQKLYTSQRSKRYQINLNLLKYMCSFEDIVPMTASTYVEKYQ